MTIINPALVALELRRIARTPSMLVPTLLLPSVLLLIAAETSSIRAADGASVATGVAKFLTFSVQASAIFALATSVASDRETRFYTILRALPVSPLEYCTAKFLTAWLLGTVSMAVIFSTLYMAFGLALPWSQLTAVIAIQLITMVPTMLVGGIVGALTAPSAATGFAGLFLFPMGYLAHLLGLASLHWPGSGVATGLPAFHAAYLTMQTVQHDVAMLPSALVWLAVTIALWGVVLGAVLWAIMRKGASDGT